MAKFSVRIKNMQVIVKSKLSSDEMINNRELLIVSKENINGFFIPCFKKRNEIIYNAPIGIPFKKHLKKGIDKNDLFFLIAQFIEITNIINIKGLLLENLILDINLVFINEKTHILYFVYQPIIGKKKTCDMIRFINDIIYSSVYIKKDDNTSIGELISFICENSSLSLQSLSQYIYSKAPLVQQKIFNLRSESFNAYTNSKFKQVDRYGIHYDYLGEEGTTLLDEDQGTTLLNEYDGTTILENDSDIGTTLLEEEKNNYPRLIRRKNNDEIIINKPVFRIGKEKSYVDYFVSDNKAISRSHADIITRRKQYYIYDNNSTNKTFVNEIVIPIQREVEIFTGNIIKIGDEEFEFHIE